MNTHKIRQDLGRVRPSLSRHEFQRALLLVIGAFKDLGGQQTPMDLRGDFRDALTDLTSDPDFKKAYGKPLGFQAGKEREILGVLNGVHQELNGLENQEDHEGTLQRKLNIDRCIKEGKDQLAQGKVSEADEYFVECAKYIKNEMAAFAVMAKAMMDAGEYVRALGHLRAGVKQAPENQELRKLAEECLALRKKQEGK